MNRNAALAIGIAFVFIALCAIMLAILPSPLGPKDYLVAGAVATILCLLLLWFLFEHLRTPARKTPPKHSED